MVEELAKTILNKVKEQYPHLEHPAVVKAVIAEAVELDEEREVDCEIVEKDTGVSKEVTIKYKKYRYTVNITDNEGGLQATYPPLPGVISYSKYEVGDTVAVAFTGGELQPVIVG